MSRKFSTEQITRIVALIIFILTAIFTFLIHEYIVLIVVSLCIIGLIFSPKISYKIMLPIQRVIGIALFISIILFSVQLIGGFSRIVASICLILSTSLIMQINSKK